MGELTHPPYRILLVCLGNICRSPIAEFVLRGLIADASLTERITVESAATGDWHVGEPAHPSSLEVLSARGYDGSAHRARKFSREWFDDYDLVVAMDRMNVKALQQLARTPEDVDKIELLRSYDADSVKRGTLDVPDPYDAPREEYDRVFEIVLASCQQLLASVRATINA